VLKLGGCTGGTTSTLPTGYQREPSLGSQVSMLLLAVPAIVLPTGLTRRSATTSAVSQPNQPLSSAASRPELVRHPTCTLPIGLPSFSRVPWHTGTWQYVASRRLVWSPSPFRPALSLCPSLGRGPELAKLREARALLSRQCRRTPHPRTAWQSFGVVTRRGAAEDVVPAVATTVIGVVRKTPPVKKRKAEATCPDSPLRPPRDRSGGPLCTGRGSSRLQVP
jgi:hypothetical protein